MATITCICERSFDAEVPEALDLAADGTALPSILEGSFLNYRCPSCGKLLKPEFPLRLVSASRKAEIRFLPESERGSFYAGAVKTPAGADVVIGYPELLDRIRALQAGLDPRALEIMKYVYLEKAEEKCPDGEIRVYLGGVEGDSILFHIHGMAKDEIAVVKASRAMYDKTLKDLPNRAKMAPYSTILTPPYISVRRLDLEE